MNHIESTLKKRRVYYSSSIFSKTRMVFWCHHFAISVSFQVYRFSFLGISVYCFCDIKFFCGDITLSVYQKKNQDKVKEIKSEIERNRCTYTSCVYCAMLKITITIIHREEKCTFPPLGKAFPPSYSKISFYTREII